MSSSSRTASLVATPSVRMESTSVSREKLVRGSGLGSLSWGPYGTFIVPTSCCGYAHFMLAVTWSQ